LSLNTRKQSQPFTAANYGEPRRAGSHEIVSTADDVSAVTFGSDSDGMTIVWVSTE
jgi:hypothetical protein